MKRLLFILLLAASSLSSYAQSLTHEQITSFSYEDMSDLLRRFPGMYPMDYGVPGAPMIIRPWGLSPWLIGAERDGIPWNRVSDGLWNSNLDTPDEMDTLRIEHSGTEPFGRFSWSRRVLPSDSPRTELHVREGYYGFGRIDFAHAQRFSPKLEAEASGRLNWYDGMRTNISKARLYNLRGSLTYSLSDAWKANLEYGGANTDVQSPHRITTDTLTGAATRISVFDEREYGTLRLKKLTERHSFDFGIHLRQDREIHDNYFRLREQLWYGFLNASASEGGFTGEARLHYELTMIDYPGKGGIEQSGPGIELNGKFESSWAKWEAGVAARTTGKDMLSNRESRMSEYKSAYLYGESCSGLGAELYGKATVALGSVPPFWTDSKFPLQARPMLLSNEFSNFSQSYSGASVSAVGEPNDKQNYDIFQAGLKAADSLFKCKLGLTWILADAPTYGFFSDSLHLLYGENADTIRSLDFDCDVKLPLSCRLQSWSFVQLDKDDYSRAIDTRSYSRLLFERDFLKAPLHIASFVAYEHIGRHEATSDIGSETVGPAHLMHVQVAATIQGVTLLWGVDNLTGQHYYYLPGYPMIAKEEYFGLRWTLTL